MEFLFTNIEKLPTVDCIIIPLDKTLQLSVLGNHIDQQLNGELQKILKTGDFEGTVAQCWLLPAQPKLKHTRVLLVGTGEKNKVTPHQFKQIIQAATQVFAKTKIKTVLNGLIEIELAQSQDNHWKAGQIVLHSLATTYQFSAVKRAKANETTAHPITKFYLPGQKTEQKSIERGIQNFTAIAHGSALTRELGNTPANICTPTHLANAAIALGKKYASLKVTVLDHAAIKKLKMGAFLAVSQGSSEPPKLICIEHQATSKISKTKQPSTSVVLVGKGITFDSGGISIKPSHDMDQMKFDMCGAASVLGVMQAIAELNLPISVVGIIPTCENLPDGHAIKPGDVVTSMSGQTIEILNTDAEGRLILCDALTYAQKYNPKFIIDIATLTGAIIVALGDSVAGLFSKDDELSKALYNAGEQSVDPVWQLPLIDEYQEALDSNFADMANVGNRSAGSITAALFLERFVKDQRWAHLDIAGVAWLSGKEKGATGRPVPLLTQFLLNLVAAETKKEAS